MQYSFIAILFSFPIHHRQSGKSTRIACLNTEEKICLHGSSQNKGKIGRLTVSPHLGEFRVYQNLLINYSLLSKTSCRRLYHFNTKGKINKQ